MIAIGYPAGRLPWSFLIEALLLSLIHILMKLKLSPEQSANLNDIIRIFRQESAVRDNLQEEMLRIILKRFIITCTRIAREKCGVTPEQEKAFDIVRRFYILVDQHFREKKQVQDLSLIHI